MLSKRRLLLSGNCEGCFIFMCGNSCSGGSRWQSTEILNCRLHTYIGSGGLL